MPFMARTIFHTRHQIFTYIYTVGLCIDIFFCIVRFPSVILTSIDFRKGREREVSTCGAHVVCFPLICIFLVLHVHRT